MVKLGRRAIPCSGNYGSHAGRHRLKSVSEGIPGTVL